MKIANADRLIHHFETVVDVHLFTVPEIITIIERFSSEIPADRELVFSQEENKDIIITDLDQKRKLENLPGGGRNA